MNSEFLLNVVRQSNIFKKFGLNSDNYDGYARGRVIAQHTLRHGVMPNLNGAGEVLGFIEYALEHANDTQQSAN